MARTKKQTIDAATARKRQIQEEILNESLALLGKRENIQSSSSEATNQKSGSVKSRYSGTADSPKESNLTQLTTDSPGFGKSSENNVDFPKAVICIPDICTSSPQLLDSANVKLKINCSNPKGHGSFSLKSGNGEDLKPTSSESMDVTDDMKTSVASSPPKTKAAIKTVPDKFPMKSGKIYSSSNKVNGKQHGRRSPRHQLNRLVGFPHTGEPSSLQKPEKPKINIFTDNLGVDLGKRVRSPRRLSEDMIALPIYSVRRTGNSPKENVEASKSQDWDNSFESSPKKLFPNGSPPRGLTAKHITNPKLVDHFSSTEPNTSSEKKLKPQGKKLGSIRNKDCISKREAEQLETSCSEGSVKCDRYEMLSSENKEKQDMKLLMSSICKDVIGEVTSQSRYLFQRVPKGGNHFQPGFEGKSKNSQDNIEASSCVEMSKEVDILDSDINKVKCKGSMSLLQSEKMTSPKEQSSSLLCAMLVGGTDVAQDYSQKKEKCKPEVADISDKEAEHSVVSCPAFTSGTNTDHCDNDDRQNQQESNDCDASDRIWKKEICEKIVKHENSGNYVTNKKEKICKGNFIDRTLDIYSEVEFDKMETKKCANSSERLQLPNISDEINPSNFGINEDSEDFSNCSWKVKEDKNMHLWKKSNIDFISQLKKLNENVLKLTDIDIDDEFLTSSDTCDNVGSAEAKNEPEAETELFKLISKLGFRLKDQLSSCSDHSSDDIESINQLIQTCPKSCQRIVPFSNEKIWNKILERWKEVGKESENMQSLLSSTLSDRCKYSENEIETTVESSFVDISPRTALDFQETKKGKGHENNGCNDFIPSYCDGSEHGLSNSSLLIQNSSLCSLDLDSKAVAASLVLKGSRSDCDQSAPSRSISSSKCESEDLLKCLSNYPAKRPFQKALTCSDFGSSAKRKILRRVSSSPQLNKGSSSPSTLSLVTATSNEEGESSRRSKLGSKIPVPGTVFSNKSCKKSWRTPRIIMDPKPLKILQQLETDCPKKDIFVSSDLQKYLWMPSSRMIVTSAIREEIHRADETAKSAWEAKTLIMKDEEETVQKKDDEKINKQFAKYKPDFDEVEGMLFMSFSSEIELKAHIHVERALEWDKEDTMLRISRAKILEETKAVNGNMKEVKMKHLRGQHMRWKKYKRLYSKEVDTLLEAKENGIPLDQVTSFKKTSDVTKIKGWKNKPSLLRDFSLPLEDKSFELDVKSRYSEQFSPFHVDNYGANSEFLSNSITERLDERKKDMSPKSRRRFNFSDRKAHRQLFKELQMDWEDRMIHRKLGGWSLKGNRPKAFSRAAIKRQKSEGKEMTSPLTEASSDIASSVSMTELDSDVSPGGGGNSTSRKKKLIYPLLTEKLARNCLKTLETGDILRALRRNKKKRLRKRDTFSHLPALTPMPPATSHLSPSQAPFSPEGSIIKEELSSFRQPLTSTPSLTSPLSLDLPDETVLEGVDVASRISSPSGTDAQNSPQVKPCSKLGCRYGCICHLCSANESPTPPKSSLLKSSARVCDKEYCRLGCICDSLDPEQPEPAQGHCGKPSCMLECVCFDSGLPSIQADSSDDIPFLPSMKQRPRTGERFSNLPRREKTHRIAKNLDAVTRKALMLYETSEIFCEKVERAKKRECLDSPKAALKIGSPSETIYQSDLDVIEIDNSRKFEMPYPQISSYPQTSETYMCKKKEVPSVSPNVEILDLVQSLPVLEPSAHKRKRKSHPLSSEIFTFSTCARIQPYVSRKSKIQNLMPHHTEQSVSSSMLLISSSSHQSSNKRHANSGIPSDGLSDLKISNVMTLATESEKYPPLSEKTFPGGIDYSLGDHSKSYGHAPVSGKLPSGLIPLSKIQESGKKLSSVRGSVNADKSHGWHTSMVCLKAKAPNKDEVQSEDDVQEEDEVKLLEFAADCNWDGAKRGILAQVASCLTRGHYPQPRTMNIGEFVVEILPKARQPTVIPSELRAKLPEQMFSIRVRITRRDDPSKTKMLFSHAVSEPMIDLSGPSLTQKDTCITSASVSSHHVFTDSTLIHSSICNNASSSSSQLLSTSSSHIGISGLSKVCVTSSSRCLSEQSTKSSSAPGSRRSSFDAAQYATPISVDDTTVLVASGHTKNATNHPINSNAKNMSVKTTGKSSINLGVKNSSSLASTSSTSQNIFSPYVQPLKLLSPPSSLLKRATLVTNTCKSKLDKSVTPTSNSSNPVIKTVNPKDLKYVQFPNKEQLMVYEVDVKTDKKTLIAVPLSLASKTGDIKGKPILTVPVPGVGQQKVLPMLAPRPKLSNESSLQFFKMKAGTTPSQPVLVKIPHVNPPVIVPSEKLSKSHSLLHFVPVTVQNTSIKHLNVARPIPTSSKILKSGNNIVCGIFENSIGNTSLQSTPKASSDTNLCDTKSAIVSTTVTQCRDRPIPSCEVSNTETLPKSAFCSSSTPLSKSTESTSHISPIDPPEISDDTGSNKITKWNETKGKLKQVNLSPTPKIDTFEDLSLQSSKSSSEDKKMGENNFMQEVSSLENGQKTLAISFSSDQNITSPKSSSSSLQLDPIRDDECFSGFSIMNDIPYSVLTSKNQTSIGLDMNSNASDLLVVTPDHGCLRDGSQTDNEKDNVLIKACPSTVAPDLESVASTSSSVKKSVEDVSVSTSSSNTVGTFTDTHLSPSLNVLKRSTYDFKWEDVSESKKTKLMSDCLPLTEDDSIPNTASPHSSCGRPKSGLSSVLSSGSSEDLIVSLSSDEEIDVGEDLPIDASSSFKEQMERAWENDHSTMYCKMPQSMVPSSRLPSKAVSGSSKGHFHKYLERARRAKLKALLSQLADTVMSIPAMKIQLQKATDLIAMPKVMILDCARKSITHLSEVLFSGQREISQLTAQNESLKKELHIVKAELLKRNMSARAIAQIVNRIARQAKKKQETNVVTDCASTDEIDGVHFDDKNAINLVSPTPSKDGDIVDVETVIELESSDSMKTVSKDDSTRTVSNDDINEVIIKPETIDQSVNLGHECLAEDIPELKTDDKGIDKDEKSAFPKHDYVSEDNTAISYEESSIFENKTLLRQETVIQYEDITDEEYGS